MKKEDTPIVLREFPGYWLYPDGRIFSEWTGRFLKSPKNGRVYLRTSSGKYKRKTVLKLQNEYFMNNIHSDSEYPDDIEGEEWCELIEYPGYAVSNRGRVYSIRFKRVLKHCFSGRGYAFVNLRNRAGEKKCPLVHRLVAEAFLPNPENKPTVDHIEHDRANPDVRGLRWATQKEQIANRTARGSHWYILPERRRRRGRPPLNKEEVVLPAEPITDPDNPYFWL